MGANSHVVCFPRPLRSLTRNAQRWLGRGLRLAARSRDLCQLLATALGGGGLCQGWGSSYGVGRVSSSSPAAGDTRLEGLGSGRLGPASLLSPHPCCQVIWGMRGEVPVTPQRQNLSRSSAARAGQEWGRRQRPPRWVTAGQGGQAGVEPHSLQQPWSLARTDPPGLPKQPNPPHNTHNPLLR